MNVSETTETITTETEYDGFGRPVKTTTVSSTTVTVDGDAAK